MKRLSLAVIAIIVVGCSGDGTGPGGGPADAGMVDADSSEVRPSDGGSSSDAPKRADYYPDARDYTCETECPDREEHPDAWNECIKHQEKACGNWQACVANLCDTIEYLSDGYTDDECEDDYIDTYEIDPVYEECLSRAGEEQWRCDGAKAKSGNACETFQKHH